MCRLRPRVRRAIDNEPPNPDGGWESKRAECEDIPACDVAHVDDPVRCEGCAAEVAELVDEAVRAHGGYGCGQGKHFCV